MHNTGEESKDSIGLSPLAIPILAGPGIIVTAINQVTNADALHILIVLATFGVMIGLTYIAFRLSNQIVDKLGANLIAVVGKIMGLILAIIGAGMVTEGIKLSFM